MPITSRPSSLSPTDGSHRLPPEKMADAGVLDVVHEQRVHGAVERHYQPRRDRAVIDIDAAASMSLDDHRQGFAAAMAALLAEFNAYLDRDGADPTADSVGSSHRARAVRLLVAGPTGAALTIDLTIGRRRRRQSGDAPYGRDPHRQVRNLRG